MRLIAASRNGILPDGFSGGSPTSGATSGGLSTETFLAEKVYPTTLFFGTDTTTWTGMVGFLD